MKKRVFHIITHFDQGGAERVAVNIASSKNPNFEYHIVEVQRGSGEYTQAFIHEIQNSGMFIHRSLVKYSKLSILLFPIYFFFLCIRWKPSIIHTHTEKPDLAVFLFHQMFGWAFQHIKYVRTIHNTELWNSWQMIGDKVETFFKDQKANVAISESTQIRYKEVYGDTPPIIYNGLAQIEQKSFNGIVTGKINVLFAGRLEYQKGIDVLCTIVRKLAEDNRFVFHIVGDGSLKSQIMGLQNLSSVRIYDKIYGLAHFLSSFDYLFMPSYFEGLALMPIEASMAKLPSIINRCPGLKDTMPVGWTLAVNENNVEDYLKIFALLSDLNRASFGERAYLFAKRKFGMERMQREYEKLYGG